MARVDDALGAPGHTPGSCLIALGSALFTGDTIYTRGVGLSHLPGEQPETLRQSILAAWPLLTPSVSIPFWFGGAVCK